MTTITNTRLIELRQIVDQCQANVDKHLATRLEKAVVDLYELAISVPDTQSHLGNTASDVRANRAFLLNK